MLLKHWNESQVRTYPIVQHVTAIISGAGTLTYNWTWVQEQRIRDTYS